MNRRYPIAEATLGPRTPGVVVINGPEFNRRFSDLSVPMAAAMMESMGLGFDTPCSSCARERKLYIDNTARECYLHHAYCDLCAEINGVRAIATFVL